MQNRKRDTDIQNRILDSVGEGEGLIFQKKSIKTCIVSRVKQITSPGWKHETSARAWCTGKSQRDRVEREVGGGNGMGNTCNSMANSCQCMTKTTTILLSNQPPTNKHKWGKKRGLRLLSISILIMASLRSLFFERIFLSVEFQICIFFLSVNLRLQFTLPWHLFLFLGIQMLLQMFLNFIYLVFILVFFSLSIFCCYFLFQ